LFWVCLGLLTLDIGLKLALIGFELALNWVCFLISPIVHFLIFTCQKRAYVIPDLLDIGFVLQKKGRICKVFSTRVEGISN
jgi:hypothetical protein